MIKKIFDWTAGSFFRTVGRLLVFVIIGFLVAKLVDFSHINWTDLLGIEYVKAVTITQEVQKMESTIITQSDNGWIDTWGKYKKELTPNEDIVYNPLILAQDGGVLADRDFVEIPILFNAPAGYVNQESGLEVVCTQWATSGNTYYCSNWSSQSNGQPVYIQGSFTEFNMFIVMEMTDSTTSACTIQNTNIICPLGKKKPKELRVYTNYRANTLGKLFIFIDRTWIYYNTVSNQDIINNQNQNHNETMSYFQDDNTTSSEDEASSFFDDFSVTDHGGLSSILTAPLTIVSKVLDDTCTPATFTYRNKQVVLPCGQYFWNQAPELRDWLSTIESGIIAYAILVALFKMIQKLESPSNSEVEVESL